MDEPFTCSCKAGYAVTPGKDIATDGCSGKLTELGTNEHLLMRHQMVAMSSVVPSMTELRLNSQPQANVMKIS